MLKFRSKLAKILAGAIVLLVSLTTSAFAQNSDVPRTTDGNPDFNGIWQAVVIVSYVERMQGQYC